ncbi:ribokinase [Caldibacillus lycopersici]|uniref:Ribokinase n=1 Tax=Perspicuibacillus lycopersici TaxID=1325689 RepID=A0AAE3LPU1_9BACI|nr:ribokinase [Perspicuibacillus lycopersici]MCU9612669.1 ribokinase [Perspicuibacillus lycopersici]
MSRIMVIGSLNMDIVSRVENYPLPGETIKGIKTDVNPGGKGANQAVAIARAGGNVSMVGAIGTDVFGDQLLEALQQENIETNNIIRKEGTSGLAVITVDSKGSNSIILLEGANGLLSMDDLTDILPEAIKDPANIFLLQNEVPWETTKNIIESLSASNASIYLNPAPAQHIPTEIISKLTGIFLNEIEATIITGLSVIDQESASAAAEKLIAYGVTEVIITLGEKGSLYRDFREHVYFTPGRKVNAMDTTAAGDTFIGAYLASKQQGYSIEASLEYATAAAALTVSREGAQKSIPYQEEILQFLT